MARWSVFPDGDEPVQAVTALAEQVERDGGRALAIYRDPVGEHWQIFCLLPLDKVEPTPYQRDLSPTHTKRLQEVVKKIDRFVDPIVVMSPKPGLYWTPNGNHRRAVLAKLKAEMVPAILVPEPEVAFQILALNTEKAHNLKEKALEVIRMYRGLVGEEPEAGEDDYAFQFESPHFITLGLLYEGNARFASLATAWPSAMSAARTSSARSSRSVNVFGKWPFRNLSTRRRIGAKAPPAKRALPS